jgi:hypothetical protein
VCEKARALPSISVSYIARFWFFLVRVWKGLISSLAAAMTTTVVASSADPHDGGVAALQAIRYTRGRGLQLLDQVRGFVHFVTFDNERCLMMSLPQKELHTYVVVQIQETSSSVNFLELRRGRRRTNVFFLLKSVTNFSRVFFKSSLLSTCGCCR